MEGLELVIFLEEPTEGLALTPLFVPPLRGWLTVKRFARADFLKDTIELFVGIQFRYMALFGVAGVGLLLNACAKTLENLVLDLTDPHGEQFFLKVRKF